jgi:hypothetical protein
MLADLNLKKSLKEAMNSKGKGNISRCKLYEFKVYYEQIGGVPSTASTD